MAKTDDERKTAMQRLGSGGWLVILMLLGFLATAVGLAFYVWKQLTDVQISTNGWIAMGLGVLFTAVIGIGLMVLVFYSSRRNYDR
jgi:hypothetical protein